MKNVLPLLRQFSARFWSFFFPRLCLNCQSGLPSEGKEYICFNCRTQLPYTNFHELPENPITDKLAGRVPLVFGGAYFYYQPNTTAQRVIHALKYYNHPEIGLDLGLAYGQELSDVTLLEDVNYLIPVPLHPKRQHQRGYNQAEAFANGLGEAMEVEVLPDGLIRQSFEASQTKKGRDERIQNVAEAFGAGRHDLNDKHVILVDDVLTTGATLEACADALLATYPRVRLSLITIGYVG